MTTHQKLKIVIYICRNKS